MLNVVFGYVDTVLQLPGVIKCPGGYFDFEFEEHGKQNGWLNDPIVRDMLRTIDRVPLSDDEDTYTSLIKCGLRPQDIANGTKNLILCEFCTGVNRLDMMGENCYQFLGAIAAKREVNAVCPTTLTLEHGFFNQGSVRVLNNGKTYATADEWVKDMPDVLYCKSTDLDPRSIIWG